MDGRSGKKDAGSNNVTRKGCNATFEDAKADKDQDGRYCNRVGCTGRIKQNNPKMKGRDSGKAKCSRPFFSSSTGNEVTGNSSRMASAMKTQAKSFVLDSKRKSSSQLEIDLSESSQSGDSEAQELKSLSSMNPATSQSRSKAKSREVSVLEAGTSSAPANTKSRKVFQHEAMFPSSSVLSISENSRADNSNNRSRYALRNLKCSSASDVLPPGGSSESKSARKCAMKKKVSEGESSISHRGRRTVSPSSANGDSVASGGDICISDARRSNNFTSGEGSSRAASVRTLRSMNVNNGRTRPSYRHNGRNSLNLRESATYISQLPDSDILNNVGESSSSQGFSARGFSTGLSSYSRTSRNDEDQFTTIPFGSAELGFTELLSRNLFQRYTIDGITEVLLALDRIEQDEELSHEQVYALETSFFLSGLSLHDQHRNLRMDIDNMSYEELLALEERMGTVSTALSEEALSKCINVSIYQANPLGVKVTGTSEDGDDIKCCICQEEYAMGDEIGQLAECRHGYHAMCINQWLRTKNWCPICKAAAAPP